MKPEFQFKLSALDDSAPYRMGFAALVAVAVHALLIFGLGFSAPERKAQSPVASLNIALIQKAGGSKAAPPMPDMPMAPVSEQLPQPNPADAQASDSRRPDEQNLPQSGIQNPVPQEVARYNSTSSHRILDSDPLSTVTGYYVAQWGRRVESVGQRNFPDVVRRLYLREGPEVEVRVRHDGYLLGIKLTRQSSSRELDLKVIELIKQSSPFAPFPTDMRRNQNEIVFVQQVVFE